MQILADRSAQRHGGVIHRVARPTAAAPFEREADGDEAIDGEGDTDPDRRVATRVEQKLLKFAYRLIHLRIATKFSAAHLVFPNTI